MLNPQKARNDLEKILDDKEYQVYVDDSKSILEIWWEKAEKWLAKQLGDLFPSFIPSNGTTQWLFISIIIGIVLLLALILFFILRDVNRSYRFRNKPIQSLNEMNWSFQDHLSEAGKQEALEAYTAATRHMFLALLLYCHEKKMLEARIWKTNWEYYAELQKVNKEWAMHFKSLALFFDEVTYGERNLEKEEFGEYREKIMTWFEFARTANEQITTTR
ncbi:protein of unknown function (DUF4129) [Schinkia azotoformans MEV2011]|uniref:DUF4129 domain-containing protein n=1 Tax=Schinkia azotoformans MEV2011 TaxID=1348973 RepID=A0A072NJL8_SCHAZ|nr:hypothetical protein [Schinkia azotoformans]KEF37073.1 protein of unknown function (DUF4129) [Schinkia azotoformans MEV2011]MEC1697696.1 DUF4129 domain-containing protein [Schinkia azotoformans]MEC1718673.1 DUF4129 domain-containing protein [Schinkia azotoformans]MEC1727446.1 DUF4129 domain-containing protein [Schinkia azotoformans]MEC1739342.1 DUF4129 domain-containing protein [Schinkia azotoformans]